MVSLLTAEQLMIINAAMDAPAQQDSHVDLFSFITFRICPLSLETSQHAVLDVVCFKNIPADWLSRLLRGWTEARSLPCYSDTLWSSASLSSLYPTWCSGSERKGGKGKMWRGREGGVCLWERQTEACNGLTHHLLSYVCDAVRAHTIIPPMRKL